MMKLKYTDELEGMTVNDFAEYLERKYKTTAYVYKGSSMGQENMNLKITYLNELNADITFDTPRGKKYELDSMYRPICTDNIGDINAEIKIKFITEEYIKHNWPVNHKDMDCLQNILSDIMKEHHIGYEINENNLHTAKYNGLDICCVYVSFFDSLIGSGVFKNLLKIRNADELNENILKGPISRFDFNSNGFLIKNDDDLVRYVRKLFPKDRCEIKSNTRLSNSDEYEGFTLLVYLNGISLRKNIINSHLWVSYDVSDDGIFPGWCIRISIMHYDYDLLSRFENNAMKLKKYGFEVQKMFIDDAEEDYDCSAKMHIKDMSHGEIAELMTKLKNIFYEME